MNKLTVALILLAAGICALAIAVVLINPKDGAELPAIDNSASPAQGRITVHIDGIGTKAVNEQFSVTAAAYNCSGCNAYVQISRFNGATVSSSSSSVKPDGTITFPPVSAPDKTGKYFVRVSVWNNSDQGDAGADLNVV
jgi:hypothetical protein